MSENTVSQDHAHTVASALELAAQLCEEQAAIFRKREYSGANLINSFGERFACAQCARAIRAAAAVISSAEQVDGRGPGIPQNQGAA
jgi:hypothetical protein